VTDFIPATGRQVRLWVDSLGSHAQFAARIATAALRPPFRHQRAVEAVYDSGVLSVIIICVSGFAVGMVLGLLFYLSLSRFGSQEVLGAIVGIALVRELAPVFTALLVTGRAGSAVTAEIGTMVVTEELDGLRMLSIDPVHFVVAPKAMALLFVMPILTAFFTLFGIAGAYVAGCVVLGVDGGTFVTSLVDAVDFENDIMGCFLKSIIFGSLLGLVATYRGYHCEPTSRGVSLATTQTVVVASVAVLIFDYFITALWGF
jgi:phospholipid/cholesterol/gamma-HCH transport system permease protein